MRQRPGLCGGHRLVLQSGREWYEMVDNNKSKSYASLFLLDKNHNSEIDPSSIKPNRKAQPRLSSQEKVYLKILCLSREELCSKGHAGKINSAYRKMANVHHPDKGGDEEKFKKLNIIIFRTKDYLVVTRNWIPLDNHILGYF